MALSKKDEGSQTVTFTEDVKVLDHNDQVEVEFQAGETVTLETRSASRWIRRGKALPGDSATPVADPEDAAPDYGKQTVAELKAILDTREIDHTGVTKKADLVDLLTAADG